MTSRTSELVIDSSVWVEFLDGSDAGKKAADVMKGASLKTSAITMAEVVARAIRSGKDPRIAIDAMQGMCTILDVDATIAIDAGTIYPDVKKLRPKISLSDVIALCEARRNNCKVLTFDNDFRGLKDAIVL